MFAAAASRHPQGRQGRVWAPVDVAPRAVDARHAMPTVTRAKGTFPKAPSRAEWDRLTPAQRKAVVAALPNEVTDAELSPPEGDLHFLAKVSALDTLKGHFKRQGKKVYLASELPVYYPGEPRFAPDLLAVVGAENRLRGKWVVDDEGLGLHVVLEVHVGGDRKKDAVDNVQRYARLGIPEYFIFDRNAPSLAAYRLAPRTKRYVPIVPQAGRYRCEQLGLDLRLEEGTLRFYDGNAILLETAEVAERISAMFDELQRRFEGEQRARDGETRAREAERRARSAAEKRVAELEALLRKKKPKR